MIQVGRCSQTAGTYSIAVPGKYCEAYTGDTSTWNVSKKSPSGCGGIHSRPWASICAWTR